MIDIISAEEVEISIDQHNKLWVNINGICALRIGHSKLIVVNDRGQELLEAKCDR